MLSLWSAVCCQVEVFTLG